MEKQVRSRSKKKKVLTKSVDQLDNAKQKKQPRKEGTVKSAKAYDKEKNVPSSRPKSLPNLGKTASFSNCVQRKGVTPSATSVTDGKTIKSTIPPQKKKVHILASVKPDNQESEKEKFFKSKFKCNPQFRYKHPANPKALQNYGRASDRLLKLAIKIMDKALDNHGTYEIFERRTGGLPMTEDQILEAAKDYLAKEDLEEEIRVSLHKDLVSRACMSQVKGQATLQVRSVNMRELWMQGVLRHEIGTHYLRSSNNRCQIWKNSKKRKELNLQHHNPTEEGLASLHSVLFRHDPCLWRSALLYYTVCMADGLPFVQLFEDIGQFVQDPNVRWDYCLRAKRGLTDTGKPGCFSKDQVYLEGALQILKYRHSIDFQALLKLGKIDYRDVDMLKMIGDLDKTRIPAFMEDIELYRDTLDDILYKNGLTEKDLEEV